MYIGSFDLGELVTFYVNTHTPSTAGVVDADAVPGYRVYEDETATPLLTGSMALLDDANTVGFYSEQITLSAANGFERGKSYTIRITGVVGGVTGVTLRFFQMLAAVNAEAISADEVAADNLESACDNYSATRGLAGTALPAAAADGAGGLPISDAGGLDLDARLDAAITSRAAGSIFTGITTLAQWLGLMAGKQVANATALTEIKATGAGSGTYSEATDSLEAIRDTAPLGTAMRGTDSAALASVCTEGRLAELDAANLPTDVAAVKTDTGNLVTRITANLFSGITKMAEWLGLIAGKQAGDATALTEIKATGAGAGTYDPTTDSNEALRDTAPMGTAMRGTDSAALASVCTEARLSELDAGTPGKAAAEIDLVKTDAAAILVDTGTTLDARIPAALVGGRMDSSVGAKAVGLALTAQEKTDVATELATYDAPTRAEATADKDEILTQLPAAPVKNAEWIYEILMVDATDHVTPETGLTITFTRDVGAGFAAATGSIAEVSGGYYRVTASAADMNGNFVMHKFVATGADTKSIGWKTVS